MPPVPPVISSEAERQLIPRIWGPWASLGLGAVVFLAWLIAQSLVYGIGMALNGALNIHPSLAELESDGFLIALATLVGAPVSAGLCGLFARLRRGVDTRKYLGFCWVSGREAVKFTVALLVFVAFSDGLTLLLGRPIVPEVMVDAYESARIMPLFWLALVCAAPIAEEFLFRGFVFEGLSRSAFGGAGTILVTSLVWAGIHLQYDWYGMVSVFAAGLMLGYIRLRTGSVLITVYLHGLMNLIATIEAAFQLHFRG